MTRDREERNRVLGFPLERHPDPARSGKPQHPPGGAQSRQRPRGGEPQRVLGFPVDWLEQFADEVLRPLLRRVRGARDRG